MKSYAAEITDALVAVGCDKAFGISGGYICPIWKCLTESDMSVYHFRHETGAAFAAMEYSLHTEKIAVVFVTSGPGITNTITGLKSARVDGARVVFISAITTDDPFDKRSLQDTLPEDVQVLAGSNINYPLNQCIIIRHPGDLLKFNKELAALSKDPRGGVLGVFATAEMQKSLVTLPALVHAKKGVKRKFQEVIPMYADYIQNRLQTGKFILWVGYGARHASERILQLAEHFKTPVISTPRGKGIFPENHPLYRGMTGFGSTLDYNFTDSPPHGVIILGTRLAELSSLHIQDSWSQTEIICVTLEPSEVRRNVPSNSVVFDADIDHLLYHMTRDLSTVFISHPYPLPELWKEASHPDLLHPATAMSVIQDIVINKHNVLVFSEIGNSHCWAAHHLRFPHPGKYRTPLSIGAMGHATCGAVGIALGGTPVVAIVGDGAMLMQSEVSSAVQFGAPVIWLVMNDSRYNMCFQIMEKSGAPGPIPCCDIPEVDFAMYGKAMGCGGRTARSGKQLEEILNDALSKGKPMVVDLKIDQNAIAPSGGRAKSLKM